MLGLVRDPEALATLLEAAGPEVVEQVERILRRRVGERLAVEIACEAVQREAERAEVSGRTATSL